MNYLLDNNVIIDILSERRREKYPKSLEVYNAIKENGNNIFISSSSIDNIEFILFKEIKAQFDYSNLEALQEVHNRIKEFIKNTKIAKTPTYLEIDYEDIEDSQIVASAKAVDATIITRDEKLLKKHHDIAIDPSNFQLPTSNYKIDFANLKKQHFMYQSELEKEMDIVLNSASYIMGSAVKELEENLQSFTSVKHAITCASGTDALLLAMMALDIKPGDEIITTPFTFIATAETIAFLGAKPVFVDIDEKTYNIDVSKIEEKITDKTKAIMPVSLYGQPSDLDAIRKLLDKLEVGSEKLEEEGEKTSNFQLPTSNSNKIHLIIDGAQSFGATYKDKAEVHYADIYTTSFFPAKPLGCYGDGGAVLTNNDELAQKMKMLRVHGQNKRYHHKYIGMGGRMDTLQCAVVNVKLKHYEKDLALRQEVASKYSKVLSSKLEVGREKLKVGSMKLEEEGEKTSNFKLQTSNLILPRVKSDRTSAWAQYSIRVRNRDEVQAKLKEQGIPTAVHYPMPLHLQECFEYLGYKEGDFPIAEKISKEIMSLPMNPYLSSEEIEYICKEITFLV